MMPLRRRRIIGPSFPFLAHPVVTASVTPSATTWNPSDKSSLVSLDGTNLVATHITADNYANVRSIAALGTSAKIYYEVTVTAAGTDNTAQAFGFAYSNMSLGAGLGGASPSDSFGLVATQYYNGESADHGAPIGGGSMVTGAIIDIAYDRANGKFWARRDNGLWNQSSSADPATNVGGFIVVATAGTGSLYACITVGYGTGCVMTTRFASSSWIHTPPSGFSALI